MKESVGILSLTNIVILFILVFEKASAPMLCTDFGIFISSTHEFANARVPIFFNVLGNITFFNSLHP